MFTLHIIYIPLWLDLLSKVEYPTVKAKRDLHSTMVRFIIVREYCVNADNREFTFHYGQIYYFI